MRDAVADRLRGARGRMTEAARGLAGLVRGFLRIALDVLLHFRHVRVRDRADQRENERGAQIGAGWDPNWHQPTDMFKTYSDADFRLGLNAAQTTLSAVALLTGAKVVK